MDEKTREVLRGIIKEIDKEIDIENLRSSQYYLNGLICAKNIVVRHLASKKQVLTGTPWTRIQLRY